MLAWRTSVINRLGLTVVALACAGLVAVIVPGAAIGDHGAYDVEVSEVVQGEGGQLLAIVSVLDHGRPVTGLAAAQFSATEDGAAIPITAVASSETASIPLSVVITLDTSGSMAGAAMSASVDAASEFAQSLAPGDPAALLSFADTATLRQGFTTDRPAITGALAALTAEGNTALYNAVAQSAQLTAGASTARKAVLLLSDGEDFGEVSSVTREESLQAAEDSGAIFYVVGLGDSIDTGYLGELVTRTGGTYYPAPSAGDIVDIYRAISSRLRGQYTVTLQSATVDLGGDHSLTISVTNPAGTGQGTANYTRTVPPTPLPTATATVSPEPTRPAPTKTPVPPAGPTGSDDGGDGGGGGVGLPVIASGAIGILIAAAGVGVLLTRSRRGRSPAEDRSGANTAPAPTKRLDPDNGEIPYADLVIVHTGEAQRAVSVGTRPLTLGSAHDSDIVLGRAGGVGREHLRLWWRDGRLMLHHLDRSKRTLVNGQPAEWLALEPGDEIAIGEYQIRYVEARPDAEPQAPVATPAPERQSSS